MSNELDPAIHFNFIAERYNGLHTYGSDPSYPAPKGDKANVLLIDVNALCNTCPVRQDCGEPPKGPKIETRRDDYNSTHVEATGAIGVIMGPNCRLPKRVS